MPDTLATRDQTDQLLYVSGDFTSTIKDSDDRTTPGQTHPAGISRNTDGNCLWADYQTDYLLITSGILTSTVKTSIAGSTFSGGNTRGASDDNNSDSYTVDDGTDKLFWLSGQFSSTVKDSEDVSSKETILTDITVDGTDAMYTGDSAENLVLQSGIFTSTIKDSQAITATSVSGPMGIGYDGTDMLVGWTGGSDKVARYSGRFTNTIKSSSDLGNAAGNYRGVDTYDTDGRLGLGTITATENMQSSSTVSATATATVGAAFFDPVWSLVLIRETLTPIRR